MSRGDARLRELERAGEFLGVAIEKRRRGAELKDLSLGEVRALFRAEELDVHHALEVGALPFPCSLCGGSGASSYWFVHCRACLGSGLAWSELHVLACPRPGIPEPDDTPTPPPFNTTHFHGLVAETALRLSRELRTWSESVGRPGAMVSSGMLRRHRERVGRLVRLRNWAWGLAGIKRDEARFRANVRPSACKPEDAYAGIVEVRAWLLKELDGRVPTIGPDS